MTRYGHFIVLGWLICSVLTVSEAFAQDRSDTGRTRDRRRELAAERKREQPDPWPPDYRWTFSVRAGMTGGGELFTVRTVSGNTVPWLTGIGSSFSSSRFEATLDRNFGAGLALGRRLGGLWSWRLDLAWSKLDVLAETRLGQSGAVLLYDRYSMVTLQTGLELRLARSRSYPYLLACFGLLHLAADHDDDLDQSQLLLTGGAGLRLAVEQNWSLMMEATVSRAPGGLEDFVPKTSQENLPAIERDVPDASSFFALTLGLITHW